MTQSFGHPADPNHLQAKKEFGRSTSACACVFAFWSNQLLAVAGPMTPCFDSRSAQRKQALIHQTIHLGVLLLQSALLCGCIFTAMASECVDNSQKKADVKQKANHVFRLPKMDQKETWNVDSVLFVHWTGVQWDSWNMANWESHVSQSSHVAILLWICCMQNLMTNAKSYQFEMQMFMFPIARLPSSWKHFVVVVANSKSHAINLQSTQVACMWLISTEIHGALLPSVWLLMFFQANVFFVVHMHSFSTSGRVDQTIEVWAKFAFSFKWHEPLSLEF